MAFLISFVSILIQVIVLLVFVKIVLSYFMDPYHPVRQAIDGVIEPMLAPIRRVLPPIGMFDFSPLVLIILVQVAGRLLINLLASLG